MDCFMTNDPNTPTDPADDDLPPRLRDALARLDEPAVHVLPALDARILSRAKADYARRTRFRPALRWISAITAVAAAVAIAFIVQATLLHPAVHLAKGDINGNGRIDMLDAYVLAKRVASGGKLDPAWDVNGDGMVDQKDVDWIASAAVSIEPAPGARGKAK
jgi:hypothetical protein